jgi:hypothetical protein
MPYHWYILSYNLRETMQGVPFDSKSIYELFIASVFGIPRLYLTVFRFLLRQITLIHIKYQENSHAYKQIEKCKFHPLSVIATVT